MHVPPYRLIILTCITSFCANWSFAFQITYVNTSVDTFYFMANNAYKSSRECFFCVLPESSWLSEWSTAVSIFYTGAILGFFLVPFIANCMGVKRSQGVLCLAATIGVAIHFLAQSLSFFGESTFFTLLSLGRLMIGLQAGSSICLLPLYIIEISPPEHRAFLNNFQQVSQSLGTLLGLIFGSESLIPLGSLRYTVMQIIAVVPILVLLFLLIFTPATPYYLTRFFPQSFSEEQESRMFYYGIEQKDMYKPLIHSYDSLRPDIEKNTNYSRKSSKKSYKTSLKGFLIGAVVACSYTFTGDDLIDTFSSNMLRKSKQSSIIKKINIHQYVDSFTVLISDALGLILFSASVIGVFLADNYGRRKLVLIGLIGTCFANTGAVIFSEYPVVEAICFAITKSFIGLGCGGPAWFLTSELVDPDFASLFQPISTGILLTSTMLETYFYLTIDQLFGKYSLLLLSVAPALVSAFLIYLFLPETKGKSNEEILSTLNSTTLSGIKRKPLTPSKRYNTFEDNTC